MWLVLRAVRARERDPAAVRGARARDAAARSAPGGSSCSASVLGARLRADGRRVRPLRGRPRARAAAARVPRPVRRARRSGARCSSRPRSRSSSGRCSRCRSTSSVCPAGVRRRACLARSVVPPAVFMARVPRRRLQVRERGAPASAGLRRFRPRRALGPTRRPTTSAACPTRVGAVRRGVRSSRGLIRNERDPATDPLRARRACCSARFFFESVVHAYYLAPGITFLLLGERSARRPDRDESHARRRARVLAFPFHPNRVLWWVVRLRIRRRCCSCGPLRRIARPVAADTRPSCGRRRPARASCATRPAWRVSAA